jgi:hypothetical protein
MTIEGTHTIDFGASRKAFGSGAAMVVLTFGTGGQLAPRAEWPHGTVAALLRLGLPFPGLLESSSSWLLRTPDPTALPVDAEARIRALNAWLDSLPDVPAIPVEALDRDALY